MSDSATVELSDRDAFARLDALSEILVSLVAFADHIDGFRPGADFDGIDECDLCVKLDSRGVTHRDLFDKLWTDDEEANSASWYEAAVESTRIEKGLYALLAGPFGQEWLVSRAMDAAARHEHMKEGLDAARNAEASNA